MLDLNTHTTVFIILFLALHWFADFVNQTREEAEGKSKDWLQLIKHVSKYSLVMMIGGVAAFGVQMGILFALLHWCGHFLVDMVTSVVNAYNYGRKNVKAFWVGIGLDQLIHSAFIVWTINLFIPVGYVQIF